MNVDESSLIVCIQKSLLSALIATMEKPYEVCGNFDVWSFEESKLFMHADQENIKPGGQGVCEWHKQKYFFHTHPSQSKAYPSSEDIMSIIDHNWSQRKLSMIVTIWGIWFVYRLGDVGLSVGIQSKADVLTFLREINETIYRGTTVSKDNTQRSVPYDDARPFIEQYLKSLKILLDIGPYAKVKFVSWNKVDKMQTEGVEEWYQFVL